MATEVLVAPMAGLVERRLAPEALFDTGRQRVQLGDVLLDNVDLSRAAERIKGFLVRETPNQIVTVNLDFVSIAGRDADFLELINRAELVVADGMPLVWLSKLAGQPLAERVAGVELVGECCRIAAETDRGVFLLGAGPGVAAAAGRELQARYPGLRIVGTYAPPVGPISPREDRHMVDLIRAAQPAFLFVALGAPRQDVWIEEHLQELGVPVAMGVGCVFDLLAGNVRRAPRWMQKSGLEWAFRLAQEPGRLWRRYIWHDSPTLLRLAFRHSLQRSADPATAALI